MENLEIINAGPFLINEAFQMINERSYAFDGYGGLFPLRKPHQDQRNIEIWYQMQAYLMENRH